MLLSLLIFAITIALVIWQPRGLGIGWSALGGAALALMLGVIQWGDIPVVWHIVWIVRFRDWYCLPRPVRRLPV